MNAINEQTKPTNGRTHKRRGNGKSKSGREGGASECPAHSKCKHINKMRDLLAKGENAARTLHEQLAMRQQQQQQQK